MQRPVIVAKPAFVVITLVVFVATPRVFAGAAQDQELQTAQPSAARFKNIVARTLAP